MNRPYGMGFISHGRIISAPTMSCGGAAWYRVADVVLFCLMLVGDDAHIVPFAPSAVIASALSNVKIYVFYWLWAAVCGIITSPAGGRSAPCGAYKTKIFTEEVLWLTDLY